MPNDFFQWTAAVVSITGAVTSTSALAYAVFRGSKELDKWKQQRFAEKKAEIAAQALVAIQRFIGAIKFAATPAYAERTTDADATDESGEYEAPGKQLTRETDAFAAELQRRWANVPSDDFVAAWDLATVFLPEQAQELFQRIWNKKSRVWSSQSTHVMLIRQRASASEPKFYELGFGAALQGELDSLREEALTVLRPLAQMVQPK